MLIAASVLFGAIFGTIYVKNQYVAKFMSGYKPPLAYVETELVTMGSWDKRAHSVGSLYASNGVDLGMQVGGLIKAIRVVPGQWVEGGDLLLELDDGVEQASLKSYQAQLRLAQINYQRDQRLLKKRAISQTEFDTVEAKLKDIMAQVEKTKAIIEQKKLYAPFAGQLGLNHLQVGQAIESGSTMLSLQDTRSLFVEFSLPEKYLPELKLGQEVILAVAVHPGKEYRALVSTIDSKVDSTTRNVLIRADLQQTEGLLPGMFASVDLLLQTNLSRLSVPQTAVSYSLFGDSVYRLKQIEEAGTKQYQLESVFVKLGQRRGKYVSVLEGLDEGDTIVVAGQQKLSNGAFVLLQGDEGELKADN
jgi:membrane fusion protein (multidrug efflux system)